MVARSVDDLLNDRPKGDWEMLFDCERDGGKVGIQVFGAKRSMTSHGKRDARNEQGGIGDEGQTRRQNASERQRRGWSLAVEAAHVDSENIIHQGHDHTALSCLRLVVVKHQDCDFGVCSLG